MDSESDYEIDYESYDSEDGSDAGIELENLYHNSKGKKEESLSEAIDDFKNLIEIVNSNEQIDENHFGFKAHKQICKCYFKMKKFEPFLNFYGKILRFKTSRELPKKYFEDSVRKILNYVSNKNYHTPAEVQLKFSQQTIEKLSLGPGDKLWFQHMMKIGLLRLSCKEYFEVEKVVNELHERGSSKSRPNSSKSSQSQSQDTTSYNYSNSIFTAAQLLQIFSLEIQLYSKLDDYNRLQKIYKQTKTNLNFDFCNVFDQGIIKELSGKINLKNLNYNQALTDFFEAFKCFDECGHEKRIVCLKFFVLTGMLMGGNISAFDSQEAKPYKKNQELAQVIKMYESYQVLDTVGFDDVFAACGQKLTEDDRLLEFGFRRLQVSLWEKKLRQLVEDISDDSEIGLDKIAEFLRIDADKSELLISYAITEKKLNCKYDQVGKVLRVSGLGKSSADLQVEGLQRMLELKARSAARMVEQMAIVRD